MKNVFAFLLLFALLLLDRAGRAQSVGIGTPTPNAKAVLDLTSTTQGLLIPRLTAAQRGAIIRPPGASPKAQAAAGRGEVGATLVR